MHNAVQSNLTSLLGALEAEDTRFVYKKSDPSPNGPAVERVISDSHASSKRVQ